MNDCNASGEFFCGVFVFFGVDSYFNYFSLQEQDPFSHEESLKDFCSG